MVKIPLSKGFSAIISDEDADLLKYRYSASVNGPRHTYAKRSVKGASPPRRQYLHRDVAERMFGEIPKGYDVDHINHDTLDCRRENLRVVPHRVNTWHQAGAGSDSRSGIRGVRRQPNGRWAAYICAGKKMRHLGSFDTATAAEAARLRAESERLSGFFENAPASG